jgi:hypothetical protein
LARTSASASAKSEWWNVRRSNQSVGPGTKATG